MAQNSNGAGERTGAPARVRLVDVAKEAEVSKSLASRVLNDHPGLRARAEVRQRIHDAAERLGYRPHAAARGLTRADTGVLSLLIPDLTNAFFAGVIRGAVQRAMERDFTVFTSEDLVPRETAKTVERLVQTGRINGVMVASAQPRHPLVATLRTRGIPHVFVNRGVRGSGHNVILNEALASRAALTYLTELGHTRIAHVAGAGRLDSTRRLSAGFRKAAKELGLDDDLIVEGSLSEDGGAHAAASLLEQHPDVTAIFTAALVQAVGVMRMAYQHDLDVPSDLSVITADETPLAAFLSPALTTVQMPTEGLGAAAVDAVIEQILGGTSASRVLDYAPKVIERESTTAPR
ncbi:MAG: LacI family DNA-binding transcriptional regulator [Actinobacteria bacterium]|nr:LacI family DNA-binding transcriptional regulator [Actinomycetota bacterium]